jgi:glucose-6-phosphate isomerase
MPLLQSVEGCLEGSIGASGLSQAELDRALDRLKPRLASLRDDYATGALPLLRVPKRRDDIPPAREALAALTKDARTLVFFGTGGSSLGGQTLAQLGGWGIPGDDGNGGQRGRPRTRFYDNLDARTLERALASLDLATTRFVVISKSGNTPETLIQIIAAIEAVRAGCNASRFTSYASRAQSRNGLRRAMNCRSDASARPWHRRPLLWPDQCRAPAGACPRTQC